MCCTRNPLFPDKVTRYELTPTRWTAWFSVRKIISPFCRGLGKLRTVFPPILLHNYSLRKDVEPGVPSIEESIETLR